MIVVMHDRPTSRTVVAGGTVATDYGVFAAHVVIDGERVSALTDDDAVLAGADDVIDARGLHVLPGAIDLHSHFEDPGHTEREDFTTGTMAAAAGGFTSLVEHPLTYPPVTTVDLYTAKRDMAADKVLVDFGLWGALTGPSLAHIPGQWAQGAGGFKAFMPRSDPSYPNVDDDQMLEGMRIVAELGGLVLVHAESDALLQGNLRRLRAAGRTDTLAHYESRPPFVEEEAVHRVVLLAAEAGARLQVVHTSSPVSIDYAGAARAAGGRVSTEVCPHHLMLDLDDGLRLGPLGVCAPALRERPLVEAVWDRVLAGQVDCLVSDHAAYTMEEIQPGYDDIFAAPLGCQVIQETVPVVLSEAVHRRGMSLDAFVRFSSTNAARLAGLHPRKGTLRPGADADLVLWDLDTEWTVDAASQQFSKNPKSPFDGMRVGARVRRTIVRGTTVYRDGEITAAPGHGRFLFGCGRPVAGA
jgi:allantoinase